MNSNISKRLLHVDSFYREGEDQTSTNFVFSHSHPSLASVRKISLQSGCFLNSFTNVNKTNNKLDFTFKKPITRKIVPGSKMMGTEFLMEDSLASEIKFPIAYQLNYAGLDANGNHSNFIRLMIDPKKCNWYTTGAPIEGAYVANPTNVEIDDDVNTPINLNAFELPRINQTDEISVICVTSISAPVTIRVDFGMRKPNDPQVYPYLGFFKVNTLLTEPDPDTSDNFDNDHYLQILPYKNDDTLIGFHYLINTKVYNEYKMNSVTGGGVTWQDFPISGNNVVTSSSQPVLLTLNNRLLMNTPITVVDSDGTHHNLSYGTFDFNDQVNFEPYDYDSIIISPGTYDKDQLATAIKNAMLALPGSKSTTITGGSPTNTFWTTDNRFIFNSSQDILWWFKNGTNVNRMAHVIGLRTNRVYFESFFSADSIPDLSGIDTIFIHSKALTGGGSGCLCGDNKTTENFCLIPVTSDYGIYNFFIAPYNDAWSRTFNEPTNLSRIDISLRDITGQILDISSDVSLVFNV